MQTIILIRYGKYSRRTHRLTRNGHDQIRVLAEKLEPFIRRPATLFSSPLYPAVDAASALGIALELISAPYYRVETKPALRPGVGGLDSAAIVDLIRAQTDKCETLILIGHMELVQNFPNYLASSFFNQPDRIHGGNLHPNHALVIDCESKTAQVVVGDIR